MFLQGGPEFGYGKDENGKRMFSVTYRTGCSRNCARRSSMVAYGGTLVPVNTVDLDLSVYSDLTDVTMKTTAEIELNRGILSAGPASSFNAGSPNG